MHNMLFCVFLYFIGLVTAENVPVLNFTISDDLTNGIAVFNLNKEQTTTKAITFCTWFKEFGEFAPLFYLTKAANRSSIVQFTVSLSKQGLIGYFSGSQFNIIDSCKFQQTDNWLQVCVRFQGNTSDVFFFGEQLPTNYTSFDPEFVKTSTKLNKILEIGNYYYNSEPPPGYWLQGKLYQYNVWKKALSDSEIEKISKCPSPKMEGDLVPWSKLLNGVKNCDDKDLIVHPRVTASTDEGPCPKRILPQCPDAPSSDGMSYPGSSYDGMSGPGTSSGGMSDPESSSGGMSDPASLSSGMSDPGSSSGGMSDPVPLSSRISDPGSSSGGM